MKSFRRFLPIYLIVVIFFMGCSTSSDENVVNEAVEQEQPIEEESPVVIVPILERLQNIVNSKVGANQLKGVTVSIRIGPDEKWNLVGGISNNTEVMKKDMRFGIASITKTAVAATILKLEEEGLLSLDDTIGDWLTLASSNVDHSITIFQLLNHLTGLKGYFQHEDIWPRVEGNLDDPIPSEELTDYIGDPLFAPGDRYAYSNSNYLVLGLIIKAVTAQSVGDVMRSRFWEPLKLTQIYFGSDEEVLGPIAAPWRDNDGDGRLEDISDDFRAAYHSIFFTAADIFATAEGLSMWSYHLYEGDALTQESKDKMLNFLDIDSGDQYWSGYGLGVRRFHFEGKIMWGHTGGMRGYGSYMLYDPVTNLSITMLNNQSRSADGPLLRFLLVQELLKEVFAELQL